MKKDFSSVRLCVLVSRGMSLLPFETLVSEVVAGGADCIQLREKNVTDAVFLESALLCRQAARGCIFIVNDRPDVALVSRADGVHVGQTDLPASAARRVVGPDALVGVSTSNAAELLAAGAAGADYVGVGAVFPTATKDYRHAGLEFVREAARLARVPFLAIGGINLGNVASVIDAGAPGVAVCSAILKSRDPRGATRAIKDAVLASLKKRP